MGSKRVFDLIGQTDIDFDISDHINWSFVSRDFNQSIAKSPYLWYLFLKKYHKKGYDKFRPLVKNPNTNGWVGIDYYERAKTIYCGKFKKIFQVEMILPEGVHRYNHCLYTCHDNKLTSKAYSIFDITNEVLHKLIRKLDSGYELKNVNQYDQLTYWNTINGQLLDTHEENFYDLQGENVKCLDLQLFYGKSYKLGIEIIKNVHLFDLTVTCPRYVTIEDYQTEEEPAIDFESDVRRITCNVYENDYQDICRHFTMDGIRLNDDEWELIDLEHKFIIPGACIDIEWMLKYMPYKRIELELRKK